MSATTISNSQLVTKALVDYAEQTGIDLTENPFADKLQRCDSAEDISGLLQDRAKAFKEYRDGNRKLINCLKPVVQFLYTFSGTLGGALVLVSLSGQFTFSVNPLSFRHLDTVSTCESNICRC